MTNEHTSSTTAPNDGLVLAGLDGSNPVGYLASLGTLQTLTVACRSRAVTMSWSMMSGTWSPSIHGIPGDRSLIAKTIADHLGCPFCPGADADRKRERAQKRFDASRAKLKKAVDALKKSGLRGKERIAAEATELGPLQKRLERHRLVWLQRLRRAAPSSEMSLGKHLNAIGDELREMSALALGDSLSANREVVDLLAAFGSDACFDTKSRGMEATPFCFITGSGHQYFLDTVRQLYNEVDSRRIEAALYERTEARDEKLSMRWDPLEDRRYALMWDDPTSSSNKARTNWAINVLAYRGLQLLPSVPTARGLATTGWSRIPRLAWTWPIWRGRASTLLVRSLLSHPRIVADEVDAAALTEIGLAAIYRADRLQVGNPPLHKLNFAPACRVG